MKFGALPELHSDDDDVDDYEYSAQTDEDLLQQMLQEDDGSDESDSDVEEQTAEEMQQEVIEERGTVTSPNR